MTTKNKQRSVLNMLDFSRGNTRDANEHPLVAASKAMQSNPAQRGRTGSLVGLLIAQASRARRRSQPITRVRVQVFSPKGSRAAKIRLPA